MARSAAFFDVDRTLIPGHSMERVFLPFLWKQGYLRTADFGRYICYLAKNLGKDMSELVHHNKHHLKDKDPVELERLARDCFRDRILPLVSEKGRRILEEHRDQGMLIVILTGSLHPLAEQISKELGGDVTLAARLGIEKGLLNGSLANRRPYGPEKARLVLTTAREYNLDLKACYAYGDHHSDVDLLATVGHPRAVNPHPMLRAEAQRRGWPIMEF